LRQSTYFEALNSIKAFIGPAQVHVGKNKVGKERKGKI